VEEKKSKLPAAKTQEALVERRIHILAKGTNGIEKKQKIPTKKGSSRAIYIGRRISLNPPLSRRKVRCRSSIRQERWERDNIFAILIKKKTRY